MIETYVDFAKGSNLRELTTAANEVIKRAENAGWSTIQCQLLQKKDNENMLNTYAFVFQRTKEVKASQQFEFGEEHAFEKQSSRKIPLVDKSETSEEV